VQLHASLATVDEAIFQRRVISFRYLSLVTPRRVIILNKVIVVVDTARCATNARQQLGLIYREAHVRGTRRSRDRSIVRSRASGRSSLIERSKTIVQCGIFRTRAHVGTRERGCSDNYLAYYLPNAYLCSAKRTRERERERERDTQKRRKAALSAYRSRSSSSRELSAIKKTRWSSKRIPLRNLHHFARDTGGGGNAFRKL